MAVVMLLGLGASAATSTYTLKWGDTLAKVASRHHIPLPALIAANDIADPNRVREGQQLAVPDRKTAMIAVAKPIAAVSAALPADGSKLYAVRRGDTLSSIARQSGASVPALLRLNGLKNANAIREGRSIKLPTAAEVPAPATPACPVLGARKFDFSNSFGSPRHGGRKHMGNDIFAKRGTPVVAPVDGTVRSVTGSVTGIGFYLDGTDGVTYYGAHMDILRVSAGKVARGDVIGTVGTTGNAYGTPAHLHFEVKPGGGGSVEPYSLLRSWCP